MLGIWRDRDVFDRTLVERIERSLVVLGTELEKRKWAMATATNPIPSNWMAYEQLLIPKQLLEIAESLRHFNEWKEKTDLIQDSLQAMAKQEVEYTEIESVCKQAEYESAIKHSKKYAAIAFEQLEKLLQSEDNLHLQEVLQMKKMQTLIADVQRVRALYRQRQAPSTSTALASEPGPVPVTASVPVPAPVPAPVATSTSMFSTASIPIPTLTPTSITTPIPDPTPFLVSVPVPVPVPALAPVPVQIPAPGPNALLTTSELAIATPSLQPSQTANPAPNSNINPNINVGADRNPTQNRVLGQTSGVTSSLDADIGQNLAGAPMDLREVSKQ